MTPRRAVLFAALFAVAFAAWADTEKQLLDAARKGKTALVRDLLDRKPNIEARNKDGQTPLILAAEEGHAETVKLLLSGGADSSARDKAGLTAWDQALISKHDSVLSLLPKPEEVPVEVDALWLPVSMVSSCFESRPELARTIQALSPDKMALAPFTEYAITQSHGAIDILRSNSLGLKSDTSVTPTTATDVVVVLAVRPGASCQQGSDHLTLAIDVSVHRGSGAPPVFRKTFGAGVRGLHDRAVQNLLEYRTIYQEWAQLHVSAIFWDVLPELLRR